MCCCESRKCQCQEATTAKEQVARQVEKEPDKDTVHIVHGKDGQVIVHINATDRDLHIPRGESLAIHINREWRVW